MSTNEQHNAEQLDFKLNENQQYDEEPLRLLPNNELKSNIREIQKFSEETMRILGKSFEIDMKDWLTIADYAKKYNMGTQLVSTWIKREVIPADCVIQFPRFNNIKIVKDRLYR